MEEYFDKKIQYVLKQFRILFVEMLSQKGISVNEDDFFISIIKNVKANYPELSNLLERVNYYYIEANNSEEKLEYMMLLYKNIKEKVYGKS